MGGGRASRTVDESWKNMPFVRRHGTDDFHDRFTVPILEDDLVRSASRAFGLHLDVVADSNDGVRIVPIGNVLFVFVEPKVARNFERTHVVKACTAVVVRLVFSTHPALRMTATTTMAAFFANFMAVFVRLAVFDF